MTLAPSLTTQPTYETAIVLGLWVDHYLRLNENQIFRLIDHTFDTGDRYLRFKLNIFQKIWNGLLVLHASQYNRQIL